MTECQWDEGLSGPYCRTHSAYTEDVGVCHVADLAKRAEQAEAALQRVRELHYPVRYEEMTAEGPQDVEHCNECGYVYDDGEPCPTILALEGDSDD